MAKDNKLNGEVIAVTVLCTTYANTIHWCSTWFLKSS